MFQLPSPAPSNSQAFSQIQSSIASTSSLQNPLRLHTQSQPASQISDYKIIQTHSPQPRHAFSLGVIPSVSDLEPCNNDTSVSKNSSTSKMLPPSLDFDPARISRGRRSVSASRCDANTGSKTHGKDTGPLTRSQGTHSLQNCTYTQTFTDPQSIARCPLQHHSHARTSLVIPPTPPSTIISEPTSPSNHTQTERFNADTASMQCRQIDGYVSFAAVVGLMEPGMQDGVDEDGI